LSQTSINPLNAKLNPICHLLALLAHHILHISRIRVKIIHLGKKNALSLTHKQGAIFMVTLTAHIREAGLAPMTRHNKKL
jgi:hypothetical protein